MLRNTWLLLIGTLLAATVSAQSPIFDLNKKLGKGINMGNMFEAPTETEWGNPFKDDYFQRIASLGFNHVRIPTRWDTPARTQQTAPYTVNRQFLERMKYVVDKALAEKLYVVLNMHHHEALFNDPDAAKPRFLSQWKQIAEYFKDYDNRLVFEVMNEPNTNLSPEKWNVFFADALAEIRKVSKTRAVLIGTANWGGLGGVSQLKVPKDDNLILTIHYYDPFNFTHQGAEWVGGEADKWLGTKWENTNLERDEIVKQFQYMMSFAKQNNLPVHIGEFGAYGKADLASRVRWTNYLARWFEAQGFSWAYWEFSAGFGIYNPSTNQYLTPLVDALLKSPMSEPVVVKTKKIFESKFDATDTDWSLNVQPQAKATFARNTGTATVDVTQASADAWHVQLVKNDVPLKKDSRYLVSFEASASADVPITHYLGKAANPYNAYSGYKSYTLSKDMQAFSFSFVMQDPDDPKARIVFDLASKVARINLRNYVLQEVVPDVLVTALSPVPSLKVFPNPVTSALKISGISTFYRLILYDLNGRELKAVQLRGEQECELSVEDLPTGVLVLKLESDTDSTVRRIVKY